MWAQATRRRGRERDGRVEDIGQIQPATGSSTPPTD
jgi:hypothetical protein